MNITLSVCFLFFTSAVYGQQLFSLANSSQADCDKLENQLLYPDFCERLNTMNFAKTLRSNLNVNVLSDSTLPQGVTAITSTDLDSDLTDLEPILNIAKTAAVIGVGESAHTVQEFSKLRAKIAKSLIQNYGYRLMILESDFLKTEVLNQYLDSCKTTANGDPQLFAQIPKRISTIHRVAAFKDEVTWMCDWNTKNPQDAILFHGIDIWDEPWVARNKISQLETAAKDAEITRLYDIAKNNCWLWTVNNYTEAQKLDEWTYLLENWRLRPERLNACQGALYNLRSQISKKHATLQPLLGDYEILLIRNAINIQMTFQIYRDQFIFDLSKVLDLRDQTQANLVLEWMKWHNFSNKTAFFAHNLHISKAQSKVIPKSGSSFPGSWRDAKSAGEFLWSHFGGTYKNIALTGYELSSSYNGGAFPIPTSPNSLDVNLSQYNQKYLAVNLESSFVKPHEHWWMHLEHDQDGTWLSPTEQYDNVIFVLKSSADPAW